MSMLTPGAPRGRARLVPPESRPGTPVARQIEAWKARWAALTPEDRRLGIVRGIGVVILVGIPVFLFLNPKTGMEVVWPGGRLVWTHTIALVPLAIVAVGFYTWRQICPLAFFGRMSEWIGWPDRPGTREEARRRIRV